MRFPILIVLALGVWAAGLAADLMSTWDFYKKTGGKWEKLESNIFLVRFVKRFGFPHGSGAAVAFLEVPLLLLASVAITVTIGGPLGSYNFMTGLSTCATVFGIFHLSYARVNWKPSEKKKIKKPRR